MCIRDRSCTAPQLATTTSITGCTPNASTYGQSVTCTVTVSASDTPTGTITWTNLSGCSTSALSGGSASCTTSTEPVGSNIISATYSGDSNNSASSSAGYSQMVNDATAATVVTSSSNPSVYGQSVTFTATISGQYGLIKGWIKKAKPGVHSEDVSGTVTWSANTGCGATSVTSGNPGDVYKRQGYAQVVKASTVNVTVGTSPAGLAFSVDGTSYPSAQKFTWTVGVEHTIATTSPQTPVAGTKETFASWSDGGALRHVVTATANTTSYTASFNTSYLLTTGVSPSGGGTVTPAAGSYYARCV